jgi:FdrA protein
MDVVLGWGCHPDPAGEIVTAVQKSAASHHGRPAIYASVCGTEEDPQRYSDQCKKLLSNDIFVAESNAEAARFAAQFMTVLEMMS